MNKKTLDTALLAKRLEEWRKMAMDLHGDNYKNSIAPFVTSILKRCHADGLTPMEAAIEMSKEAVDAPSFRFYAMVAAAEMSVNGTEVK